MIMSGGCEMSNKQKIKQVRLLLEFGLGFQTQSQKELGLQIGIVAAWMTPISKKSFLFLKGWQSLNIFHFCDIRIFKALRYSVMGLWTSKCTEDD